MLSYGPEVLKNGRKFESFRGEVLYNNNKKFRSFKSKENIHKKEVGSNHGYGYQSLISGPISLHYMVTKSTSIYRELARKQILKITGNFFRKHVYLRLQ